MDATDRQRDAEGGEGRGGGGQEGEGEVTHIKSNNPHLTGGEKKILLEPTNVWWMVLGASNTVWRIHSLNTRTQSQADWFYTCIVVFAERSSITLHNIPWCGPGGCDNIYMVVLLYPTKNDQISHRGK